MSSSAVDTEVDDPIEQVQEEIRLYLNKTLDSLEIPETSIYFEIPPDPKFGDFSTPICMGLAKKLKKKPREIALDFKKSLDAENFKFIDKIEIAGPGYLNFFLNWPNFISLAHEIIIKKGNEFGTVKVGKNQKVVVEHTSVNPNKPIHLGTARCAVLGDLTGRLLKSAGYEVEIENYIDDLGAQVAVMLHGYKNFKDQVEKSPDYKDDYYLGLIYVKGAEDIENKKENGENIKREILHKMEQPQTEENKLALNLVDMALKGQLETLWRMNIFYDLLIWERHIVASGLFNKALTLMQNKNPNACYKIMEGPDKDCIVLDMSMFGEKYTQNKKPYKILMRSNGVSTYTGKDVAFQIWKFGEATGFLKYRKILDQPNKQALFSTISATTFSGLRNLHFPLYITLSAQKVHLLAQPRLVNMLDR